jgi:ABC-type multidrug transport system ATPase subunit
MIEVEAVIKRLRATQSLAGVDLTVKAGHVLALLGSTEPERRRSCGS